MNIKLLKTFRILYVEDEDVLREEVAQNIAPFVKEVVCAVDGIDGFNKYSADRNYFDIIITDILMPRMNGLEMVDKIRKIDAEIPIIYTTAFNDNEYMQKTIEQSIVSYIIKPIDIEQLFKAIEKASFQIENERLKRQLLTMNEELERLVEQKTKELRDANKELVRQLHTDNLTKLSNRRALLEDINKMDHPVVSIIDIDSFKTINDLYGESVGNEILISCASQIKRFAKANGYKAYRMGADVFAMSRDGELNLDDLARLIKEISSNRIWVEKYSMMVGIDITIGVCDDTVDIVEKAHMALVRAKERKISLLMYGSELDAQDEYENDIKWTKIIKESIENNKVVGYYQPIVDANGQIAKYECLMRILQNDEVFIPCYFLDIAKKVKLYPELTKIIIKTAFENARKYKKAININLSIQDISNKEVVTLITDELANGDVAEFITFELLESESIEDYEKIISFINMIKSMRCKIAIDDFGSGYSNFSYLLRLKPDYIKIDGSLVKNIHIDHNSYLITKTINDFAHSLNIKTVAEFVHCKEVFELLKEIGVDRYQGFYFSKPNETIV